MTYKIKGFINTIDSEGNVTFCGAEGFCLEKEGEIYNVFWKEDCDAENLGFQIVAFEQKKQKLYINLANQQMIFQMLVAAQVKHQKVLMNVDFENALNPITNITLL